LEIQLAGFLGIGLQIERKGKNRVIAQDCSSNRKKGEELEMSTGYGKRSALVIGSFEGGSSSGNWECWPRMG
jgi:hypothetical protein